MTRNSIKNLIHQSILVKVVREVGEKSQFLKIHATIFLHNTPIFSHNTTQFQSKSDRAFSDCCVVVVELLLLGENTKHEYGTLSSCVDRHFCGGGSGREDALILPSFLNC